jgi:prepilin-type N-terminal cleavage/methylation domain-containing protein
MYSIHRRNVRRQNERGVTIIEMLIAIAVLSIGLAALAQLFVVSTMNNAFAVNVSGGVTDAQRLLESWKVVAKNSTSNPKISDPLITSSMWDTSTNKSPAFDNLDSTQFSDSRYPYKQYVWVYDKTGLVGSASPGDPPGVTAGSLRAPSITSRLVYIRLVPKTTDPRFNQVITLVGVINAN